MFEPDYPVGQDRKQDPRERVAITPQGEAALDRYMTTLRLIEELRLARQHLVDLPRNVREQLRIDCLGVADAAHELTRLEVTP